MNLSTGIYLAFRGMARYRLRAFLMMAGVMVGMGSLTVLRSVGEATRQQVLQRFKNMVGTFDTVIVRPGKGTTRGMVSLANVPPTLKFADAQAIAIQTPEVKQVAELQDAFDIDVQFSDRTVSPAIFGVSENWLALRDEDVAEGTFFSAEDELRQERFAVLGGDVLRELFPNEDPLGKTIRIADVPFLVTGVLRSQGAGPTGSSLDDLILIPVTTASRRLFNRDFLTMLILQVRDPNQSDQAVAAVTALLRERHHIATGAIDDFTVTNPRAVFARVTQVGGTLEKILLGAALLATTMGVIVIASLMLIGVSERRGEIGVRRSVGASQQDILFQFLLEAAAVAFVGGATGVGAGLGTANLISRWQRLPPVFSWTALASAGAISAGVGLLAGLYPAWKAASMDPVAALRSPDGL